MVQTRLEKIRFSNIIRDFMRSDRFFRIDTIEVSVGSSNNSRVEKNAFHSVSVHDVVTLCNYGCVTILA